MKRILFQSIYQEKEKPLVKDKIDRKGQTLSQGQNREFGRKGQRDWRGTKKGQKRREAAKKEKKSRSFHFV